MARSKGFSCYDDYLRDDAEHIVTWHKQLIADRCATTGSTREQAEAVLFHQNESQVDACPNMISCNCKDSPHEVFCPHSLVNYRSQDWPVQMAFSHYQNLLKPEELIVKDGDQSKRLDQATLEKWWMMDMDGAPAGLPFWAPLDRVVQYMVRQDAHQITLPTSPYLSSFPAPELSYHKPAGNLPSTEDYSTTSTRTSGYPDPEHRAFSAHGIGSSGAPQNTTSINLGGESVPEVQPSLRYRAWKVARRRRGKKPSTMEVPAGRL
ncbi:MAG: hypothetical protein Q9222_002410 [Ikaeria aurantiellina]